MNSAPIEAENKHQLEAFIELGLQLDISDVEIKEAKVISPKDLTFKKTSNNCFNAYLEGEYIYTAYIENRRVLYISPDGEWDNITKTPIEWFQRMPNFNLEFDVI